MKLEAMITIVASAAHLLTSEAPIRSTDEGFGCNVPVEGTECTGSTDAQVDAACDVICASWDFWVCTAGRTLTCRRFASVGCP
jgi:hypothetical protein